MADKAIPPWRKKAEPEEHKQEHVAPEGHEDCSEGLADLTDDELTEAVDRLRSEVGDVDVGELLLPEYDALVEAAEKDVIFDGDIYSDIEYNSERKIEFVKLSWNAKSDTVKDQFLARFDRMTIGSTIVIEGDKNRKNIQALCNHLGLKIATRRIKGKEAWRVWRLE